MYKFFIIELNVSYIMKKITILAIISFMIFSSLSVRAENQNNVENTDINIWINNG